MPNISTGIKYLSQSQLQNAITSDIRISSPLKNGITKSTSDEAQSTSDKLDLSTKARALSRDYTNRENRIKNQYDTEKQRLETEYQRKKQKLEAEYQREKQAIGINIYA